MPDNADTLLQMKSQIDQAIKKESELTGQLKELMSRLKKDFACTSLEKGDEKLEKMKSTLATKQSKLDKGVASLQKKMEQIEND